MRYLSTPLILALALMVMSLPASANSPQLLFDQGHGQLFFSDRQGALDLSELAGAFTQAGFNVSITQEPLTQARLAGVQALVISGAFASPDASEIDAIMGFLQGGGKLAVMLHVGPLVQPLLQALNVQVSKGVLHDNVLAIAGKSTDFPVSTLAGHVLFENLTSFNLYGAWALRANAPEVRNLAITQASAWLSLDRSQTMGSNPQGRFPVMVHGTVGQGAFIIFGDDAMFQNQFLTGNNRQLADNVARWLLPAME